MAIHVEDMGQTEPNQMETKNLTESNPAATKSQTEPKLSHSSRH